MSELSIRSVYLYSYIWLMHLTWFLGYLGKDFVPMEKFLILGSMVYNGPEISTLPFVGLSWLKIFLPLSRAGC
jgi:hypothetical protein